MPESELVNLVKEMEEYEKKGDYQKAANSAEKAGLHTRVVKYSLLVELNTEAAKKSTTAKFGITPVYLVKARMYCEEIQAYYTGVLKDLICLEKDPSLGEKELKGYIDELKDNFHYGA